MFIRDLRLYVIRPALQIVDLWTKQAEVLLAATAYVETNGEFLKQEGNVGDGGLGIYQIEPSTHLDLKKWLKSRKDTRLLNSVLAASYMSIIPLDDEPLHLQSTIFDTNGKIAIL